jgi:benzoate/toluate 1,2-dioxygenase reductase subunit
MTTAPDVADRRIYTSRVTGRRWLTADTFTLELERPPGFRFTAGQRIQLLLDEKKRDYSLIPGDRPEVMELLIRSMAGGPVSTLLGRCPLQTVLSYGGPGGHFIHHPSPRQAVFIATGTGVAPFAAMSRSGVRGFVLLHGVRHAAELYYRELLESSAAGYIPCLTGRGAPLPPDAFPGRVSRYLQTRLPPEAYDFYLAGRREMIADVMAIVDDCFPSARVYSEIFF